MEILRLNSKHKELVKRLQRKLRDSHFNPGLIDGDFGPATLAAVVGFQKSEGLLPDGIVGPKTAFKLGLVGKVVINSAIPFVTASAVSRMFPNTQVDNIKSNLPFVLDGLEQKSLVDKPMILMALASIRAETESFLPISEYKSKFNTSPGGHPFDLYDHRNDLGNSRKGHGEKFKGRGFIQLTGRFNYKKYGKLIGLGEKLLRTPELANEPDSASKLLAVFLKDKEDKIKRALLDKNLAMARKLVNGGTHGLNRFVETYQLGTNIFLEI